jgi:hypothetical protein
MLGFASLAWPSVERHRAIDVLVVTGSLAMRGEAGDVRGHPVSIGV